MLPLLKKINIEPDAVALYQKLKHLPYSFLLDSAMPVEGLARYSFIGASPFLVFCSTGNYIELSRPGVERNKLHIIKTIKGNPFGTLKKLLSEYTLPKISKQVPFTGGAVGYFAYELGRQIEKIPELARDDLGLPDCWLGFYDTVVALDHKTGEVYIISTGLPEKKGLAQGRAIERLAETEALLLKATSPAASTGKCSGKTTAGRSRAQCYEKTHRELYRREQEMRREDYYSLMEGAGPDVLHSDFNRAGYCAVVERARDYIAAGDIFQVNLSQRFSIEKGFDPWEVYKCLRQINPAPMAAFLDFGELAVASASPERFLRVTERVVDTRPIKGTRPRGKDLPEDRRQRNELWNSEKDRSELVMIVDLERNDLGRVCRAGSVRVPELYRLEEYATVFHLVSTVTGELEHDRDLSDLLAAAFPGGSITGAPKIRAMEIIEELEPVRRGIYCGSIGYLGFDGDADLNIVIRTLLFKEGKIYFQVGGGITIDSVPDAEYLETLDKALALVKALGLHGGNND